MDDACGSANARARDERVLLVLDEKRELSRQDIERVRMLPVEMRARSRPSVVELRFRDGELFEVRLEHDPAAEERLARAGSVNDPCHFARV